MLVALPGAGSVLGFEHALEAGGERASFDGGERLQVCGLDVLDDRCDGPKEFATGGRELDAVTAAVGRIGRPRDQSALTDRDGALLRLELPDRSAAPGAARNALTALNGPLQLVSSAHGYSTRNYSRASSSPMPYGMVVKRARRSP